MSEVLNRIIQMTEVAEPSDNDYVHLQSPTLGDRRIKANRLGGGSSEIDWYLDNKKVASTGGSYITTNLDKSLVDNNWYIVSFSDEDETPPASVNKRTVIFFYEGGTATIDVAPRSGGTSYTLTLTQSTASLSNYPGDYRDIYCKISRLDSNDRTYGDYN